MSYDSLAISSIILGFIGIGVTISVAIKIYCKQKEESENTKNIIKETHELTNRIEFVTNQQKKVIDDLQTLRKNHVSFFLDHIIHVLENLKKWYGELNGKVILYMQDPSEQNLNSIDGKLHVSKMVLAQLISLTEAYLPIAKHYLFNPWFEAKFLEVIPLLGKWILIDKDDIRSKDNDQLLEYSKSIRERIDDINGYLAMFYREKESN